MTTTAVRNRSCEKCGLRADADIHHATANGHEFSGTSGMSAASVSLEIVCPEWCKVSPADHASNLWDFGGNCLHISDDVIVEDPAGHQHPLDPPRFGEPVRLSISTSARPEDNRESSSPVVYVGDREYTVGQALAMAEAIVALVERYRAAGGTA